MDIDIDYSLSNLSLNTHHIETSVLENMNSLSIYEHEIYDQYTDYDTNAMNMSMSNPTKIPVDNVDATEEQNVIDEYDNSPYVCFGIPNKYCKIHFDDEDFICIRYDISNAIKKYIKDNNYCDDYTISIETENGTCDGIIVDYSSNDDNPDIIYAKILYIYQYINNYYDDLKHLKPIERIKYLPENLINCVENIINSLKKIINNDTLQCMSFVSIEDIYFKELVYGLNVIICQLKLMLNHFKKCTLWHMEETHIKQFFKIVNNICVIIIFMKFTNKE